MDRRHHGCVDETGVSQGKEVESVVDHVELVGAFEQATRCARTRRPWARSIRPRTIPSRDWWRRVSLMVDRVGGGEQRDVVASSDEPLGEQRRELLPRSVVPRRSPPHERGEHRDAERRAGAGRLRCECDGARVPSTRDVARSRRSRSASGRTDLRSFFFFFFFKKKKKKKKKIVVQADLQSERHPAMRMRGVAWDAAGPSAARPLHC